MARKLSSQRMVYVAAAIVIAVTALWAVLFLPRLDAHPQAIRDRVDRSSKIFFAIQLIAAAVLTACVVLSRRSGRILGGITGLLYLAAALLFLHDFMVFNGAVNYLQTYEGFRAEAILMLVCVGADLIAAILAIKAGHQYLRSAKQRVGERAASDKDISSARR